MSEPDYTSLVASQRAYFKAGSTLDHPTPGAYAPRDRGTCRLHAGIDLPRALDLRLEPAPAARPPGDALDRRARYLAVGLLHPRRQLMDAAPGRVQGCERRGAADERLGASLQRV